MNCNLCKFNNEEGCTRTIKPQPNIDGRCTYFIAKKDEACTHYWIIGTPTNGISSGVCKLCDEKRNFSSSVTPWKKYDWRKRPLISKKGESD